MRIFDARTKVLWLFVFVYHGYYTTIRRGCNGFSFCTEQLLRNKIWHVGSAGYINSNMILQTFELASHLRHMLLRAIEECNYALMYVIVHGDKQFGSS